MTEQNAPSSADVLLHQAYAPSARRDFLYYATASAGAVATGAAVWPLINSMNPSADIVGASTVRVDLTGVEEGQRITVKWQGRPVFIWRRSPQAIAAAQTVSLDDLVDPVDTSRENPNHEAQESALDENRAADATGEWLVVIGVCTHLGCIPLGQDGAAVGDFGGWFC
ncbi:MAG: ubiquinol-cytochrome c reductase iron-sulfur subunit, partial [Rhizobiaceae bacterium]|nr:ubiquinol-cytochrome c reductase iron-sulfur subunit [Rhizobiaceae bacterium]